MHTAQSLDVGVTTTSKPDVTINHSSCALAQKSTHLNMFRLRHRLRPRPVRAAASCGWCGYLTIQYHHQITNAEPTDVAGGG